MRSDGEAERSLDVSAPPAELLPAARTFFGDRLELIGGYAQLLATDGVVRGLIGPRETTRIWDRHLLNCAAIVDLVPSGASVVDVGSGAGLPGIVLAVARPELAVILVEPLARRTEFLSEAVARLGLSNTTVVRGRAEDCAATIDPADIVTARAVAPLDRLAGWCLPLVRPGGRLLAFKGASARDEVAAHRAAILRLGGSAPVVRECGEGVLEPPTTVVEIVRERVIESGGRGVRPSGQRSGRGPVGNARGASAGRWSGHSGRRGDG
jgi:16S rRNA (guanine527-N7)-methyltransferase